MLRRIRHVLLIADTAPVDALLWWLALCWAVTLALEPERSYHSLSRLAPVLAVKGWWVGPAVLAVLLPLLCLVVRWDWLCRLTRLYAVGWWTAMAVLLALLLPSFPAFWGPALAGAFTSMWLLGRQAAGDAAATTP